MDLYEIRRALGAGRSIFDIPLRVTFYARVSTDKDEQLHSLSAQVEYFSDYICKVPNWTLVNGYVDQGLSGTSVKKRQQFLQMIDHARLGQFDFIITKEISRFSRNTLDSIQYTQELLRYGVGILFQSDNINTLLPDAELRLTIMSSIAQDEVRKISERVKFGFQRAIEKGVVLGSNRIWGYEKDNGTLVIKEDEAQMVRLIFDLYANQMKGIRAICTHLTEQGYVNTNGNPFSFSTVAGILKNPKYKGYYCGGKTCKYDYKLADRKSFSQEDWVMYQDEAHVPPIVSEALWHKANQLYAERSAAQRSEDKGNYQSQYPFSGKIICNVHQRPYYRQLYRYKSGNKEVWQCKEYTIHGKSGCSSPVVYTAELEDMLSQSLRRIPLSREEFLQEVISLYNGTEEQEKIQEKMTQCRQSIEDIHKRKDRLLDLTIHGHISDEEFSKRNEGFNGALAQLEGQLVALISSAQSPEDLHPSIEAMTCIINRELDLKGGFTIGLVHSILDKILVIPTESKDIIQVKMQIKLWPASMDYQVERRRGKPSICSRQYT